MIQSDFDSGMQGQDLQMEEDDEMQVEQAIHFIEQETRKKIARHPGEESNHPAQKSGSDTGVFLNVGYFKKDIYFLSERIFPRNQDLMINMDLNDLPLLGPRHQHDFYKIIYVFRGEIEITHFIKEKAYVDVLKEKDFCLLNPFAIHQFMNRREGNCVINILIRKNYFEKAFYQGLGMENSMSDFFVASMYHTSQEENFIYFPNAFSTEAQSIADQMLCAYADHHEHFQILLKGYLHLLFTQFLNIYEKQQNISFKSSGQQEGLTAILAYVYQNYSQTSLADVAGRFHYNPDYLSRRFKKLSGNSFSTFLQKVRFERALELLKTTDFPVEEIAEQTGMTTKTFYKMFKDEFEGTTKEYRNGTAVRKKGSEVVRGNGNT